MATRGTASRLTCVPNWEMVSAIHSRRKSAWPSRPEPGAAGSRWHGGAVVDAGVGHERPTLTSEASHCIGDLVEQRRVGFAGQHPDE